MLVEEIMQKMFACPKDAALDDALKLLKKHKSRHFPVLENDGEPAGPAAERNFNEALPTSWRKLANGNAFSQPIARVKMADFMPFHRFNFSGDLSAILYEHKIGCPVAEDQHFIGLVAETDMLCTLAQRTGAVQPSSAIETLVDNKPGTLAHAVQMMSDKNSHPNEQILHRLAIRIQTMEPASIPKFEKNGYSAAWPSSPERAK